MRGRVVKPPPKVTPHLNSSHRPAPPPLSSPAARARSPPPAQNDDFEALVQAEMARMEAQFRAEVEDEQIGVQSNEMNGNLHSDWHNFEQERNENHFNPSFDRSYESPYRAKGGGLSSLHGPQDDRKNLKAAKAAAYARDLEEQIAMNSRVKGNMAGDINGKDFSSDQPSGHGMLFGQDKNDELYLKRRKQEQYRQQLNDQEKMHESPKIYYAGEKKLQKGKYGDDGADALSKMYDKSSQRHIEKQDNLRLFSQEEILSERGRGQDFNPSYPLKLVEHQQAAQFPKQRYHENSGYRTSYNEPDMPIDHHHINKNSNKIKSPVLSPQKEKRMKQEEYRRQLELQRHEDLNRKIKEKEYWEGNYHMEHGSNSPSNRYPESSFQQQQEAHASPVRDVNKNIDNNMQLGNKAVPRGNCMGKISQQSAEHDKDAKRAKQVEYRRQLELQRQEDLHRKKKEKEYWEGNYHLEHGSEGSHSHQQGALASPVHDVNNDEINKAISKGNCVGKISQESSEHDKDAKRAKQIDYRRQLERQREEDRERKKKLNAYYEHKDEESSQRDDPKKPREFAGRADRNDYNAPNYETASGRDQSRYSPQKSPTKARNRLVDDVYGGGSFFGERNEDVERKWRPSKGDSKDEQKRRAMLEQKAILQQQIEEKRKRKEEEAEMEKKEREQEARNFHKSPKRRNNQGADDKRQEQLALAARAAASELHSQQRQEEKRAFSKEHHDHSVEDRNRPPTERLDRRGEPSPDRYEDVNNRQESHMSPMISNRSPPGRGQSREVSDEGPPRQKPPVYDQSSDIKKGQARPNQYTEECLDLLDDLGLPKSGVLNSEIFNHHVRRVATPGGALESESHILPLNDQQSRRNYRRINAAHPRPGQPPRGFESLEYREGVEQDDVFLVDWQHNNGYSSKRGMTGNMDESSNRFLEASFVSESKLLPAKSSPWAEGGLLAELSLESNKLHADSNAPKREQREGEGNRLTEQSLTSESILTYLGRRTPNTSSRGRSSNSAMKQNNSLHSLRSSVGKNNSDNVPNSPLQKLVDERGNQVQSRRRDVDNSSRRIDSRDTLERLLGNSFERVGDSLLLSTHARENFESDIHGKNDVNGTPSNEVLVVQSPSSSADNENMFASSCGSDRIGSQTVSSPNDYVVNEVTREEKELMQKMLQDRDLRDSMAQSQSIASNSNQGSPVSRSRTPRSSGRYVGDDDDDDDAIDGPTLDRPTSRSSMGSSRRSIPSAARKSLSSSNLSIPPLSSTRRREGDNESMGRPSSSQRPYSSRSSKPNSRPGSNQSDGAKSKAPKSKWNLSERTKEQTTEALRQRSSNRIVLSHDEEEDNSENETTGFFGAQNEEDDQNEESFRATTYGDNATSDHEAFGNDGFVQHSYEQTEDENNRYESHDHDGFVQHSYEQAEDENHRYESHDHDGFVQHSYEQAEDEKNRYESYDHDDFVQHSYESYGDERHDQYNSEQHIYHQNDVQYT